VKYLILTNNPLATEKFGNTHDVRFMDVTSREILHEARRIVCEGSVLLNHPLYGSVKPNETPYRSLLLTKTGSSRGAGAVMDERESAMLIDKAFVAFNKFTDKKKTTNPQLLEDYQVVDLSLLASAVEAADA
jgi:hypothetical protein